ncbi:RDD family protein [candidate division KSB1 bacterium]|nr:RDD family protein [candidate division KSB1 bacterium]
MLVIPTIVVTLVFAAVSLLLTDPDGFHGIITLFSGPQDEKTTQDALADIAPLLVRIDAQGLPASVKVALEEEDYRKAGELLKPFELDFSLVLGGEPPPLKPGYIRVDISRLIPGVIRGSAIFGTAILYFTLLTAGGCPGTFGKRLVGIRVVRIDNRPLSLWESFERVGGYLASVGTLGLGLLDLCRDPNRRLAHDRISHTVVMRKST